MNSELHRHHPKIEPRSKKLPYRMCYMWKQYVEGDWKRTGNIVLEYHESFRVMVDRIREVAAELKAEGAFVMPLKELNQSNQGYGYVITEPPVELGVPGEAYNLLVSIEYRVPSISDPTYFSTEDADVIYYDSDEIKGIGRLEVLPDGTVVER